MEFPSINVAICTYNNAKLVDLTLSKLALQEVDPCVEWSVLVVDNNSTDETSTVVQNHIQLNHIPDLRLVHERQQGLGHARRRAVRETSSELIAFVDDDCLLSPDWVQQAVAFCREHPMAGAMGGRVQLLWEVSPAAEILGFEDYLARQEYGDLTRQMPSTGETYLVGAGLVLKRAALIESGWMDTMALVGRKGKALTSGDDSEMVLRIRNAGYELWYNPAMQLQHYIPKHRISSGYLCRLLRGIGQSWPTLYVLGNRLQPTLAVRTYIFGESIRQLSREWLRATSSGILQPRSAPLESKIYLSKYWGRLEGAARFLLQGAK